MITKHCSTCTCKRVEAVELWIYGFKIKEIAIALGITPQSVEGRICRWLRANNVIPINGGKKTPEGRRSEAKRIWDLKHAQKKTAPSTVSYGSSDPATSRCRGT